ncbi:MAG TPA: hypothetical protein VF992_06695 [Thermoplasmata archaeon]
MVRDVRYDATPSMVVQRWRSAEDGLRLQVRGSDDEFRLQCRCGRCHWIIREQFSDGKALLLLTCHNCGTRATFAMEGVTLPAP